MTLTFITFLAGYNIQYTLLDAMSPVIGISFVLILLRLNPDKHGSNIFDSHATGSTNYPIRSISITVAKHVDVDSDLESRCPDNGSSGHIM